MPIGYIPFEYTGMHPRITGWKSYNNAKYNDARVWLGDALGKNVLTLDKIRPVMKQPFRDVQSKRETDADLLETVDAKETKCFTGGE